MSIQHVRTTSLTDDRRAELLQCLATGQRPRPLRTGLPRPMPVAVVRSEAQALELTERVPGAVLLGAGAATAATTGVTRRDLLRGVAAGGFLVALPGGLTGCTPEQAEVVAQLVFLTIAVAKAIYTVLEEICGEVIVENPGSFGAQNIGMDLGLVDSDDFSDLAGKTYGEFSESMQDTLRSVIDIPPVSEFVLEFCDIRAEYPAYFWLAGAILDTVLQTEDVLEVTEA